MKIGHIDCEKDTYQILKSTLSKPINDDLKLIKSKYLCVPKDNTNEDEDAPLNCYFIDEKDNNDTDNNYFKIKVVGCGDLKFISTCLGRVNREGYWCYLCSLGASEFCHMDHDEGEKWTLAKITDRLKQLYVYKTLNEKDAQQVKGCTDEPLFDALEPWDWIIPILHIMMGIFNSPFTLLLQYIEERYECVGPEERASRNDYYRSLNAYDDSKKELETMIEEKKMLENEIKEQRKKKVERVGITRKFLLNHQEKRIIQDEIDAMNTEKKALTKRIDDKDAATDYLKDVSAELKAVVNLELEKSGRNPKTSAIRQKIEQCLKKNGIDRGFSHGGMLEGVACLKLENNVEIIIEEIESILINHSERNDEEEIHTLFSSFRIHFLLASHTISLIRTERNKMNPNIHQQLREVIPLFYQSTERLSLSMKTPKRHILSHALDMIITHGSIAEYMEDWVEQLHQKYKKSKSRGKIRDNVTLANYQIRADAISINPRIMKRKKENAEQSRRNFKGESKYFSSERTELLQAERRQRRLNAVEEAKILFANRPTLPTAIDLNKLDARKEEREEEDELERMNTQVNSPTESDEC
mgnify:CR=1 FL=1